MNSDEQLTRVVQLVAELNRRAGRGEPDATLGELAERFGTSEEQIRRDVVTLTSASDEGADWLASIGVRQEGDRLSITSRGPFRRPVRLTVLEVMAIQVGLAAEPGAEALSRAFADLLGEAATRQAPPVQLGLGPSESEAAVLALSQRARDERRTLLIRYVGTRDRTGVDRVIEPHDVVHESGRYYIVAWCRKAAGWRHFRVDRVLDAALESDTFTPRDDAPDTRVVYHADESDDVEVRFAPAIARWIHEEHAVTRSDGDGGAVVTFHVADPAWLVRSVLQYGAEAEVVGPVQYREVMALAVSSWV